MSSTIQLRKLRDFGERFGDTMQFIKLNWVKLLGVYAVFVIPFLLVGVILGAYGFFDYMTTSAGTLNVFRGMMSAKLIIAFLMFIFSGASYTAALYLYMDHYQKTNGIAPTISELGQNYFRKFISNIGYTLLAILSFTLVACLIAVVFYFLKNATLLLVLMAPIGFILLLFAMVFLVMMYTVNVLGDENYSSVFGGTFQLLKGRWWYSTGYLFILIIIFQFFSMAISGILNLIFGFSSINMLQPADITRAGKGYAYVFGLTIILQQLFYLIVFVGCGIHYYSLTEEKVGVGLEQQIDKLGTEVKKDREIDETF